MTAPATIYWIGAGPGDPTLITVKAQALIEAADVIVADALNHARLLQHARPEAVIHDVGSRRAGNKMAQADVTQLLLAAAQPGKTVVRLWPGDPFVFGYAAQEMAAARQAGLRLQLVPGVTSAVAAPAYAGVPLTHWEHNAGFAVVSGFIPAGSPEPDWATLARLDTLVIMMPLEHLAGIVARLQQAGCPADTPALLVAHGSLPAQKQALTTLAGLVETAARHNFNASSLVVLGEVARLSTELGWFQPADYPLLGQRVLVTRPIHQAADFMAALRELGAEPLAFPTIEIKSVTDTAPLDAAIRRLAGEALYDWLVLTSVNGVAAFWERLAALGLDSRCLASVQIAAIGPATAEALRARSINPDLVPEVYTAEGVLDAFDRLGPVAGQRFLLARADIARKTLTAGLAERGAMVDEFPAYRTVPVAGHTPPPPADILTFTSSSTVQGYVNSLQGRSPAEAVKNSRVVCIGPITAGTAEELGLPVSAVAAEYTIEGILSVLKGGLS